MSTRCNILVKEKGRKDIILYHHHDGYPQGVGADLVKRFKELFGRKESYIFAIVLANKLVKDSEDEYEITNCIHGDIEYLYTIDCSKKEISYKPVFFGWNGKEVEQTFGKKCFLIKNGVVVDDLKGDKKDGLE